MHRYRLLVDRNDDRVVVVAMTVAVTLVVFRRLAGAVVSVVVLHVHLDASY